MKVPFLLITFLSLLLADIGQVTALTGSAELLRENRVAAVTRGDSIKERDLLTTAARSRVQVILHDDTVVTVGPESEYRFERFRDKGDAEVVMELKRGFFKTVTGKIGKIAPHRFKIKTRAATIGIRGTQFMAYVNVDEEKIGCIGGEIVVATAEGEYVVPAGKMLIYREKQWRLYEIEMGDFAPVLVGMAQDGKRGEIWNPYLPSPENSYLFEEQIINQYQTGPDVFSFDLGGGQLDQPPTALP